MWMQAIKDLEDRTKSCQNMEKHKTEKVDVLKSGKELNLLLAIKLEKLFLWHDVPKKDMGNKMQTH